jgi:photosystem II stability/assembly factor-like uncharacterized protein
MEHAHADAGWLSGTLPRLPNGFSALHRNRIKTMTIHYRIIHLLALLALLNLGPQLSNAYAQGTAFTYQGHLNAGGVPANGNYDLTFTLFGTNASGVAIAGPLINSATAVSNGQFSVTLNFGSGVFTGNNYWLEIGVQTNGGSGFTTLAPRQPILPVPYAIMANSASNLLGVLSTAQLSGTIPATNVTGTVSLAQLPGSVVTNGAAGVNFSGTFSGNGSGLTNVPSTFVWQAVSGISQTAAANQAYLLTNNGLDTLTLPTSPNVGDVVTVTGVGNNGWQVAPGAGQTIVGTGATWTQSSTPAADWYSVASSADGSHLVVAVFGGGIYTSTDFGINWTQQTSAPSLLYGASAYEAHVASSSDGSHLVAVVQTGGIYTSTNFGINWTEQLSAPSSVNWSAVASSADGSHLVAAVSSGGIYTSTNFGINWTQQTGAPLTYWSTVTSSSDGSHLAAAIGASGINGEVYTSTNFGINWTAQTGTLIEGFWSSIASSSDGSHLAATIDGAGIYVSTDFGNDWGGVINDAPNASWDSIASSSDGSHLVAAADGGGIYTSTNFGINWKEQLSAPASAIWQSITSSSDGSHLVAVGYNGIFTSTNFGITWNLTGPSSTPSSAYWATVTSSSDGSHLVAAIWQGGIYTSINSGVTFTQQAAAAPAQWSSIASSADGSHLVATVQNGGTYTSTNFGINWTQQTGAPSTYSSTVTSSSDGSHLAAVYGNSIYTSTNFGINWTQQAGAPAADWYSIASSADGGHLVAAVQSGGIYTSTNFGINWTQQTGAPSYADWDSVSSSADGSHLVAAVLDGGIYTSANFGINWTQQTGAPADRWFSVASSADGSHLVAVAQYDGIYISTNYGINWAQQTGVPSSADWDSVASSADGSHLVAAANIGGIYIFGPSPYVGVAGEEAQFQYIGNGVWQPLATFASQVVGTVSGNGSGLTNLNASQLTSGIVPLSVLPTAVVTNMEAGVTLNGTFSGILSGNGSGLTNLVTPTLANYVYAYCTTTNAVVTAGTFQNITNDVDAQLNNWTHTAGTVPYTNSQSGLYMVQYTVEAITTASTTTTVSLRALDNGTEIAGSQCTAVANTANQTVPISKSFIARFNSGDVLQFQFVGSSTDDRLVSNFGLGTIRPSFSCTIVRIQ